MPKAVEFHTGVPDALGFACRLLRKAYRADATVVCVAPAQQLEMLDRALWTFVEREFVPHVVLGKASAALVARTPIWLAQAWSDEFDRQVALGLGLGEALLQCPARVIEIVGSEVDEVERGRSLWRQYKAAGFEIVHHPFGVAAEP
jgi:DNA polymerase III subunit chi